jgi:putative ABC transport system substrate-binding protein
MKRREFIALAGGAAAALPLTPWAQQPMPLVGFLNTASPTTYRFNADSFREGLARAGFVEGRNVRIEERWANGDYQALPGLAAQLVAQGVVVIAATGDVPSARAAREASRTVPVVFTIGPDPVRLGLVESMNRPGGRLTGVSLLTPFLGAKRIELLRQVAPKISRVALLMNPNNPSAAAEQADAQEGARKLGLDTVAFNAANADEIDTAFEKARLAKVDALFVGTDPIILDRREQIVAFAHRHALPGVYWVRQFAAVGGLLSYGPSISWMYRQAGEYVGKILKGANPAEMPVMQPTTFELIFNARTAKELRLTAPPSMLAMADEVIQ